MYIISFPHKRNYIAVPDPSTKIKKKEEKIKKDKKERERKKVGKKNVIWSLFFCSIIVFTRWLILIYFFFCCGNLLLSYPKQSRSYFRLEKASSFKSITGLLISCIFIWFYITCTVFHKTHLLSVNYRYVLPECRI